MCVCVSLCVNVCVFSGDGNARRRSRNNMYCSHSLSTGRVTVRNAHCISPYLTATVTMPVMFIIESAYPMEALRSVYPSQSHIMSKSQNINKLDAESCN